MRFPGLLWPLIEVRWSELGYTSLSAYLTGLLRYDLLIGGPHLFNSGDSKPHIRAALDRETLAVHEGRHRRKLYLDHLIERAEGRQMEPAELEAKKSEIAKRLLRSIRRK